MSRFVIDPLTLLELARQAVDISPSHRLVAPNALRSQALDQLLVEVRLGALTEDEALALHERITRLKIRLLGDRVSRRAAWKLALGHDWSIMDAEYIAVTKLQADALATIDTRLASRAAGIVPVASLADLLAE